MTIDEVLKYFGNTYRMEKEYGIAHGNVRNWRKKGYVPIMTQMKLEELTKGVLKADLSHCKRVEHD